MTDTKISTVETSHPLAGTHKVYFDDGGKRYRVTSLGPRYLIAVCSSPGQVGRIVIPDTLRRNPTMGYIVGLGDGVRTLLDSGEIVYEAPRLPLGALVLYGEHAGMRVHLGDEKREFRLIEYGSISAVLTEEE